MSRRHAKPQLSFGSDSFLDIVANIVGILIILIVVAGVRVSRIPVAEAHQSVAEEEPTPLLLPPAPDVEDDQESTAGAAVDTAATEPSEPPAPVEPPAELVAKAQELKAQRSALDQKIQSAARKLRLGEKQVATVETQLASTKEKLRRAQDALERRRAQSVQSRAAFEELRSELAELEQHLLEAENEKVPTQQIAHRLTPVSREVDGPELHFHLAQDRVAPVPVEDLIDLLKRDVQQNKDWIVRTPRYQGEVGPVRGFTMTYIVQRRPLSILQELRSGRGIVQIGISQWKIEPAANLAPESAEQALQPGSRFYQALLSAPRNATLTFWVYPDSFGLHRQLQTFAQREGYTVAARPLPFGIPIAGSPNGTRSAGQ